jgi:peptide/nickel transport system substrate-binding protein
MSRLSTLIGILLALGVLAALGLWIVSGVEPPPNVVLNQGRAKPQGGFYTLDFREPTVLNPYLAFEGVALRIVLDRTHDTLMEYDPATAKMRPSLAETYVADGRKITFTIRSDARFSDGSRVKDEDLLFTFELVQNKIDLGATGAALEDVASVKVTGPRTLEVVLKTRTFESVASIATGYIVGQKQFFMRKIAQLADAQGDPVPKLGEPRFAELFATVNEPGPGTGPYKFARWVPGQELYIVQNEYSWRLTARPDDWNLAGLRLMFFGDPAGSLVRTREGTLDLYSNPDAENILRSTPGFADTHTSYRYDHRSNGHYYVIWNHRRQHLGNPEVRRALTMLFDRDEIVKEALSGCAARTRTWFRPGSETDLPKDRAIPFHPKRAREILDEASASDLTVEIRYAGDNPSQTQMMDIAMDGFRKAGVELKAISQEGKVLFSRLESGDFDGVVMYVGVAVNIDPYYYFHKSQRESGRNWMGYDNDVVNRLLSSARKEFDADRRASMYREFNEIFLREQPVTLLAHPLSSIILSKRFHGVKPGAMGLSWEKWWVEPSK